MEETSKKVRHTPGPWGLVYADDGKLELGMSGTNEITGVQSESGFGTVALVINRKTNILGDSKKLQYETFKANACLISAAPQLLEALEEMYMHEYGGNSVSIEDALARSVNPDLFEQKIINAIKLAKGEIKTELI